MEPIVMSSTQYPERIYIDGILPTLRSRMGTGGGNVPVVMIEVENGGRYDNNEQLSGYNPGG